ncbi:AsmA-like C-terminal domain-containing protein [Pacificispira sp.]|uniref:YhdP family protein n=1 Tax=Pacificispira sp. TaxID=2888761 RepID=UPI003BAC502F
MAKMNRRTLRIVLEAVAALVLGLVLLVGAGIYALSTGPVSVSALTPILEEALNDGSGPYKVSVEDTRIVWGGWDRAVDVVASNVRVQEPDKPTLAVLQEVSVGLSFKALMGGEVRLTTLELLRPSLTLVRDPDGRIALAVGDLPGVTDSEGDAPTPAERPDAAWMPVPSPDEDALLPQSVLDALTSGVSENSLLGGLQRFSMVQAEIRIIDRALGETLWLHSAGLDFVRSDNGLDARLVGSLETPTENALIGASLFADPGADRIDVTVAFDTLDTNLPIRYMPDLVFYLPDLTISGEAGASFDLQGKLKRVSADLTSAAGGIKASAEIGDALPEAKIEAEFDAFDTAVWLGGLYDAETAVSYLPRVPISGSLTADIAPNGTPLAASADLTSTIGSFTLTTSTPEETEFAEILSGKLTFSDVAPRDAAQTAPALGMLSGADVTLDGVLNFSLTPDGQLQSSTLTMTIGEGRIAIPDAFALPPLKRGRLSARTGGPDDPVVVEELFLDFDKPSITASGILTPTESGADISINGLALDLEMGQLPEFWPAELAPNPREWVLENIPKGDVPQAGIALTASLPGYDPDQLVLEDLSGSIRLNNADVHYLRPLEPVVGVDGFATFGPSRFDIDVERGTVNDARLTGGRIEITDLDIGKEKIDIALNIDTPLQTALTLLDTDPFNYISKIGLETGGITGQARTQVRFRFPLLEDLNADEVEYEADALVTGLSMYRADLDATIAAEEANLVLRPGRMDVTGNVTVDGIPASAVWRENFSDVGERLRYLSVTSITDIGALGRFGLTVGDYASGRVGIGVNYAEYRSGSSSLALTANLSEAVLAIPPLGWTKESGLPSDLFLQAVFMPDGSARIENVILDGKTDHRIEGSVDLVTGLGDIAAARIKRLKLGDTDVSGTVQNTGDTYRIDLVGPQLDVAPFLAEEEDADTSEEEVLSPKIALTGRFQRMTAGPDRHVSDATLAINASGERIDLLSLSGFVGDGRRIDVDYVPNERGGKNLNVLAEDTGLALAVADLTGRLEGGTLQIQGFSDGPDAPLRGRIDIRDFRVREAPRLAKLLEVISVTGILSALSGDGIDFNSLSADFSVSEETIEISDGAARGSSIGITFQGTVDRLQDTLKLNGDVAVSGIFSQTFGQIPLIDMLVGDGLIGAAYSMSGPMEDPSVSVNPLSVIAPGFLRKVFEGGGVPQETDSVKDPTNEQHGN